MTERLGRADLHIHTLASDGTAGVAEILDAVLARGDLDVIAITDHERIDAALAARAMAARPGPGRRGRRRRGGHDPRRPPARAVRRGADPAVPVAALDDRRDPRPGRPGDPGPSARPLSAVRPGLGPAPAPRRPGPALPPGRRSRRSTRRRSAGRYWHGRVVRFAAEHGLAALGNSDAHTIEQIGLCYTTFPGRTADDLRVAILARTTHAHGDFHGTGDQLSQFSRQLRKYGARRPRRGRRADPPRRHGPGPRLPRRTAAAAAARTGRPPTPGRADVREDRAGHAVHLSRSRAG